MDCQNALSLGIDAVHERLDAREVSQCLFGSKKRQLELDRLRARGKWRYD
jgi:hypothetical protein